MFTANYFIGPSDGWTLVAVAPDYLSISGPSDSEAFYVWGGTTTPATNATGIFCMDLRFWMDVSSSDSYWIRSDVDQRIDVITDNDVPPPTDGALLKEDGSYILQENGSRILLE